MLNVEFFNSEQAILLTNEMTLLQIYSHAPAAVTVILWAVTQSDATMAVLITNMSCFQSSLSCLIQSTRMQPYSHNKQTREVFLF